MENENSMINMMGLDLEEMKNSFINLGKKSFQATQVFKWIHQKGIKDFSKMTNLSKSLKLDLQKRFTINVPRVFSHKVCSDGTHKWLIQLEKSNCIETVYIPEVSRGTLCISSQVGCKLNCSFCYTGKQGFNRNLTVSEIISQIWIAVRSLSKNNGIHDNTITNIVAMGMGEPLMNFDNLLKSTNIMRSANAYAFSKYRVTISTSGIVPRIYDLLEKSDVSLTVSLHASTDDLRNELVPINKRYNIKSLMAACKTYIEKSFQKKMMFEYTLILDVNDDLSHAAQLANLLKSNGIPSKVNLIPFNPYPHTLYKKPSNNRIHRFQNYLMSNGIFTTIRKTRGSDISAACGQLSGSFLDKTKRRNRFISQSILKNKK